MRHAHYLSLKGEWNNREHCPILQALRQAPLGEGWNPEEGERGSCACVRAKPECEEIGRIHLDSRTCTENQAGTAHCQKGRSEGRNLPEAQLHGAVEG